MALGYAFQNYDKKTMARVIGTNLPISRKSAREIGVFIKNKQIDSMISYLQKVAEGSASIPYGRANKKRAHHAPFGPAGFPRKSSLQIVSLLESLKSNAQAKGMNTSHLFVIHAAAHKGARLMHPGGRERKNTHFEIVAQEKTEQKGKNESQKTINEKRGKK